MSYILDALRRAQAERERGQVPGLDAQVRAEVPSSQPQRRAGLLALGAGLALAAVGLGVGLLWRGASQPAPAEALVAASRPQASAPAARLATAAASAASGVSGVSGADGLAPPGMVVLTAPPPPSTPSPAAAASPQARVLPVAPVAPAADAGVRAVTLAQLGADLRRELPPLALGGAIWSDNVASRFVIVNGQVLREGDTAAPGVVLERVAPKSVFVRWRDWRIELPL